MERITVFDTNYQIGKFRKMQNINLPDTLDACPFGNELKKYILEIQEVTGCFTKEEKRVSNVNYTRSRCLEYVKTV